MSIEFIQSERPNNIFYGDIFKIAGKGCLVFGAGKTKACRCAIDNEDDEVALDFACITEDKENVYGHFETTARAKNVPDPISHRIKLSYFIRMLDEEETAECFNDSKKQIIEILLAEFIKISTFNITFDVDLDSSILSLQKEDKIEYFTRLANNHKIRCLVVPWLESHEQKGVTLREYICNKN